MLTITDLAVSLEALEDERIERWRHTRFIAWASLKPYSEKDFTPEKLMELKGDKEAFIDYFNRMKSEGKLSTISIIK